MEEGEREDSVETKAIITDQEKERSLYPIPKNESDRIKLLQEKESFQRFEQNRYLQEIAKLASSYFNCQISLINLVEAEKIRHLVKVGLEEKDSNRADSFCTHTILPDNENSILIVPDAMNDSRFAASAVVEGPHQVKFYAGAPLLLEQLPIGTLCVMDSVPKASFSNEEQKLLKEMANTVSLILAEEEQDFLVEDTLIIPILTTIYLELLNQFDFILQLKKETANKENNDRGNHLLLAKSSKSSTGKRKFSATSMHPEIQIHWNTFKQKILTSHILLQERFLENRNNQSQKVAFSLQPPQQHLFSFHLPTQYSTISKYLKSIQNSIQLDAGSNLKIKWEAEMGEEDHYQIGTGNQSWIALLVSLLLKVELQKWKTIKINASISGEENIYLPPRPRSSVGSSKGASTDGLLSENIGIITFHLDINCTNRFANSSWIMEDFQFFQEMDRLFTHSWQVIQGQYTRKNPNPKLNETIHIAYPIVCQIIGTPTRKARGDRSTGLSPLDTPKAARVGFLNAFSHSVRSFNRSFWNRMDSGDANSHFFASFRHRAASDGHPSPSGGSPTHHAGVTAAATALNRLDENKGIDDGQSYSERPSRAPPTIPLNQDHTPVESSEASQKPGILTRLVSAFGSLVVGPSISSRVAPASSSTRGKEH